MRIDPDPSERVFGPYWSRPIAFDPAELHATILRQLDASADKGDFKAYMVQVFGDRAEPSDGMFEIAFNRKTGRACAIYEAASDIKKRNVPKDTSAATDPIWVRAVSPQSAANAFFQALIDQCDD
ncbi:hypothetical protein SAMN05216459_1234 [Ensifer sp. OV372]|nr:hypothetical protein SAMN05216459_1234 [Ensifer sp. OV372]